MTQKELHKALNQAYRLGQIYWQQADSEYASQWKKSDQTHAQFEALVKDSCAQLAEQPAEQEPYGLPLVISGAIFDFAGYMTTRTEVIEIGSTANASPVVDLMKEFANLRGLSLDDAAVLSWQEWLSTTPRPRKRLTDDEIAEIAATPAAIPGRYVHSFARAIEDAIWRKT
jgi:hypothetical protein